jgi:hypothetical protein
MDAKDDSPRIEANFDHRLGTLCGWMALAGFLLMGKYGEWATWMTLIGLIGWVALARNSLIVVALVILLAVILF